MKGTEIISSDKIYDILSESEKTVTKHIDLVVANTTQ